MWNMSNGPTCSPFLRLISKAVFAWNRLPRPASPAGAVGGAAPNPANGSEGAEFAGGGAPPNPERSGLPPKPAAKGLEEAAKGSPAGADGGGAAPKPGALKDENGSGGGGGPAAPE